jgi:hypothetical protein
MRVTAEDIEFKNLKTKSKNLYHRGHREHREKSLKTQNE